MIVEPKKKKTEDSREFNTEPKPVSVVDAFRMRITMAAALGLMLYIFLQVLF